MATCVQTATYHPLRLHPPDTPHSIAAAQHGMGNAAPFVVRLLPAVGLEGAFRVHLSPEALETLSLRVGDLCQITGEHGQIGFGIAWRATDKMGNSPKVRPAKMTESLRSAFGFKEGSQVTIAKTNATIVHADRITLIDVTPPDFAVEENDDGRWMTRTAYLFANCEAIANGVTFEVAKKGLKRRYCVDHVDAPSAPPGSPPALYVCNDETKFVLTGETDVSATQEVTSGPVSSPTLDISQIGGLVDQVRLLNRRLDRLLQKPAQGAGRKPRDIPHVLLHGYEGTGKSLLLKRLEQTNACRMFKLDKTVLAATPGSKATTTIQGIFKDAVNNQPSVLLMDRIDKMAPADTELYADTLGAELDKLKGSRVLVVAATRNVANIDSDLITPGRLEKLIELPVPDIDSRRSILNVLLDLPADSSNSIVSAISAKTHAFTGSDLVLLVNEAHENAQERYYDERDNWINISARLSMVNGATEGSVNSQDTTEVATITPDHPDATPSPELPPSIPLLSDFETALTEVRPTALREVMLEKPTVHWSDIGGSGGIKQRFDQVLGWPLNYPDIFARYRAKPQRGVLLYGPPGCSKTLTAQAVATTYDLNFLAVKGAELISMYVGESERAIRDVFRKARQAAPCIIFFDEIDSIGAERDSTGTKGLNVLTTLLNEMDGFETANGVLVLAATNKPEVLDSALMRPGRFDDHIYLGPPNAVARMAIFQIALAGLPLNTDVNLEDLVAKTDGYSGAEIVRICETAKSGAMGRDIAARASAGESNTDAELGRHCREDFEEAIQGVSKGITSEMLMAYEAFAGRE